MPKHGVKDRRHEIEVAGYRILMDLRAAFVEDGICPLCLVPLEGDAVCPKCGYNAWEDDFDGSEEGCKDG